MLCAEEKPICAGIMGVCLRTTHPAVSIGLSANPRNAPMVTAGPVAGHARASRAR